MYYLKKLDSHSDYESFIAGGDSEYIMPNISRCVEEKHVHYNPRPHNYSKDYFTITSLDNFNIIKITASDSSITKTISASTNNGKSWFEYESSTNGTTIGVIDKGKKMLIKGLNDSYGAASGDAYNNFSMTKNCNIEGNIMSLVDGDNFKESFAFRGDYNFAHLFNKCNNILSIENLILPATTLSEGCYYNMFYECSSITATPKLPARTMTKKCYSGMFFSCNNLSVAPELPATELAERCYDDMFFNCGLTEAPELPATRMAKSCYEDMFAGCDIRVAPELLATELAEGCYEAMFWYNMNLTVAPELPATELAERCYFFMFANTGLIDTPLLLASSLPKNCYRGMFTECENLTGSCEISATSVSDYSCHAMFDGCKKLTKVTSKLPPTTLAPNCYEYMFRNCESIVTAPELPALELVNNCYHEMFSSCKSLNYIKAMFTTTPAYSYTGYWVTSVASTGTFVKNASATWTTTGYHGVPNGWTIVLE